MCLNSEEENDNGQNFNLKILFYRKNDRGYKQAHQIENFINDGHQSEINNSSL